MVIFCKFVQKYENRNIEYMLVINFDFSESHKLLSLDLFMALELE